GESPDVLSDERGLHHRGAPRAPAPAARAPARPQVHRHDPGLRRAVAGRARAGRVARRQGRRAASLPRDDPSALAHPGPGPPGKKTAPTWRAPAMSGGDPHSVLEQYEALRREATATTPGGPRGHGLALVLSRGL